ncbi:MAG: hypothetical protein KA712_11990 [Myxococcales bacterium]|nr:hypothetical protein [Myxococcales bacterium]
MAIRIENIFGSFELRRPVRPGEDSAVSFNLPDRALEQALRQAVDWHPGAAWDLIDQLGEFSPRIVADSELMVGVLVKALRWGRLVLAREGNSESDDPADRSWAAYDTFVALFGREFLVGMRAHRLVGRESAIEIRREADYDVVPAAEAQAIVTNTVKTSRKPMAAPKLELLTKSIVDLRAPAGQLGFVLLRAPSVQAARPISVEEVVTPAKLKKLAEERLKEPRWLAEEPVGSHERSAATASIDDEVYVRVTTSGFSKGTGVTFVITDAATQDVVEVLSGSVGDGDTPDMAHASWRVPEHVEAGRVVPDTHEFIISAEAAGQRTEGGCLKIVPSIWEILLQFDPDAPGAKDDELILLDGEGNEVERVGPAEMTKQGRDWVLVKFKNTRRLRRYTLIRDHGPDEGCGPDVLFWDMSPDELENEQKELTQGEAHG